MAHKRIISFIVMLAVMLGAVPFIGSAEETDKQPVIEVIGSTIKNDKNFFELTMKVTPGSKGFFSAGMTLQYDSNVITPVAWDSAGTNIPMEGRVDWQNVASVPAVCPPEIAGKTAFACNGYAVNAPTVQPEEPVSPVSTPELTTPEPEPTPEITARDASEDLEESPEPEASPLPEISPLPSATASPSGSETVSGKGYLYISAEAALPVKTLPKEGRIMTVRFRYAGTNDEEIAANKEKVIKGFATKDGEKIVTLADDNISAESPAGQMVFYGAGDEEETEYYYTTSPETEGIAHDELLTKAPEFILEKDADSANTGGSDPSQFAALVFFDWDESTLLGSMVVDGAAAQEEIIEQTNNFALTLMAPNADGNLPSMGTTWADTDAKNWVVYNAEQENGKAKYPLSSHDGYTFGKWIEFDSEDFTVYGESVDVENAATMIDEPAPESPTYQNISGGLVLKAAYTANVSMTSEELSSEDIRRYTFSFDEDPNAGYFGKYGSSAYKVRVKVMRLNQDNKAIYRPRKTALKVSYFVNGTGVVTLLSLDNVDEQIADAAAPADATSVTFTVIDIGGIENWATGAAERSSGFLVEAVDYKLYGGVVYLNEQVEAIDTNDPSFSGLPRSAFTDVGLSVGASPAVRKTATKNLAIAQEQKFTNEGKKYLTLQEMINAIANNGNYLGS